MRKSANSIGNLQRDIALGSIAANVRVLGTIRSGLPQTSLSAANHRPHPLMTHLRRLEHFLQRLGWESQVHSTATLNPQKIRH